MQRLFTIIGILFFLAAVLVFKDVEFGQASATRFDIVEHSKQMYALETVEIADTLEKQTQGLSGRTTLTPHHGLLFTYKKDRRQGIWMKDMLFSIDIIWMDKRGVMVYSEKNIHPDTYPRVFTTPTPARYILEVNAGTL